MLLLVYMQLHFRIEIPLVLQGHLQVLTGLARQERVIHHWRLTHLSQRTINPRAVPARHRIHAQRYLHRREPTRIALLAHIILQLIRIDILVFPVGHHLHFIEHQLVVCQVARRRTTGKEDESS